ncbi:hypothetical protein F5Y16DRAFT_402090 [Xylariaceae sp. FL0255]|nr:hypothetical protein F5Y16DRAFT_402090 [Xylariaceae sp. FL0255]
MNNLHSQPFFIHPLARARRVNEHRVREQRAKSQGRNLPSVGLYDAPSPASSTTLPNREEMAEKVATAAKELAEQLRGSKSFLSIFLQEYKNDVKCIELYVDKETLRHIWQKKVESNDKNKNGEKQDVRQKFSFQTTNLEDYLRRVEDAAEHLAANEFEDSEGHDPLQHQIEKVRTAGVHVVRLSRKSVLNEAACQDLIKDLEGLESLVAAISDDFETRDAQGSTKAGWDHVDDMGPAGSQKVPEVSDNVGGNGWNN